MLDKVIPPMHIGQMMGRVKHHTCVYHMRGLPLWLHAAARGFPVAVEGLSPAGQGHCLVWHSALPGATYNKAVYTVALQHESEVRMSEL